MAVSTMRRTQTFIVFAVTGPIIGIGPVLVILELFTLATKPHAVGAFTTFVVLLRSQTLMIAYMFGTGPAVVAGFLAAATQGKDGDPHARPLALSLVGAFVTFVQTIYLIPPRDGGWWLAPILAISAAVSAYLCGLLTDRQAHVAN
jgi:hypothetical protein